MKLFVVLLAAVACCSAATLQTIPAVPFEESLPRFDDAFFADEASSRIISGHGAAANQFPHQVHVRITTASGAAVCGASIISASWVLTAAHCTVPGLQFTLRFGSVNANSGGLAQTVFRERVVNHPQYNPQNLNNDVALVPIPSPLSFSPAIRAIRLPTRGQASATFVDQLVTVSGWGAVANNGGAQVNLRWVNVRVISNAECARTFGGSTVVGHVVCTVGYNGNQGVCGGDSGGPLYIQEGGVNTQIGVVSFGASALLGGCTAGRPSGFMRTASFLPWIEQNTGIPTRG